MYAPLGRTLGALHVKADVLSSLWSRFRIPEARIPSPAHASPAHAGPWRYSCLRIRLKAPPCDSWTADPLQRNYCQKYGSMVNGQPKYMGQSVFVPVPETALPAGMRNQNQSLFRSYFCNGLWTVCLGFLVCRRCPDALLPFPNRRLRRKKTSMSSDFAHAFEVVTAEKKSQDPSVSVVVRWARLLPRGGGCPFTVIFLVSYTVIYRIII